PNVNLSGQHGTARRPAASPRAARRSLATGLTVRPAARPSASLAASLADRSRRALELTGPPRARAGARRRVGEAVAIDGHAQPAWRTPGERMRAQQRSPPRRG